jgi:serine/threonine protein kinase
MYMTQLPSDANSENQLNEVLLAYVEACEGGDTPDREHILAMHPTLRDDLRLFFRERDRIERLGGTMRPTDPSSVFHFGGAVDVTPTTAESVGIPFPMCGQLGDFRLLREVGRGGMGIVYEALQISLGRRVAVKVLPFASALDPRQLQRFKNEASAAAHLRHENIVAVHAVGTERGVHFFAMQFIEGQSLAALISELRQPSDSLSNRSTVANAKLKTAVPSRSDSELDWIAKLGRQAALALEHAHQTGVIHRDIKPGNLLLDTQGQLWITDFGLAQMANDGGLTVTGELLGTLRYSSPEQTLGRRGSVDFRSDIYSLGATLYELLTLRPPFDGSDRHELLRQITHDDPPTPRSIDNTISASLEMIVLKALRKEPSERYSAAQEMADDLQRYLERKPIHARAPSIPERFWGWTRRNPQALLICTISLLVLTVASVAVAVLVGAEQERTRAEQRRTQTAYHAERLRAEEAESRYGLARRAVDEMVHISEEELADRPESAMLRKRVLRSALAFYQEFLVERNSDPKAQFELQETTVRVERILSDLETLRSATHYFLLCQPVVLDDLNLSESQRENIRVLTNQIGREWMESFQDIGVLEPTQRARRALDQARSNDEKLSNLLNADQQKRLRQIGLQYEGATAFRDQEVAIAINLSKAQRERIRMIEDDAAYGWMRNRHANNIEIQNNAEHIVTPNQRIKEVLSEEQSSKWLELTGPPLRQPLPSFPQPSFGSTESRPTPTTTVP